MDSAMLGTAVAALERDADTCELLVYETRADDLVATATITIPACREIVYAAADEILIATDTGVTFASVSTATVAGSIELDHSATGATLRGTYFTIYDRSAAHNVMRACVPLLVGSLV